MFIAYHVMNVAREELLGKTRGLIGPIQPTVGGGSGGGVSGLTENAVQRTMVESITFLCIVRPRN